jgi:glyceraldehyde-3-phosphate dehydrogenase/erythrose-4-phosphate dehydrogenase
LIFSIGDNRSMKNVEYDKIYGIIEPFMNVDYMVYQLKYDSVHKRYPGTVCSKKDGDEVHLVVNGVEIKSDLTKSIDAPVYSIDSENKETRIAHPTMLSNRNIMD